MRIEVRGGASVLKFSVTEKGEVPSEPHELSVNAPSIPSRGEGGWNVVRVKGRVCVNEDAIKSFLGNGYAFLLGDAVSCFVSCAPDDGGVFETCADGGGDEGAADFAAVAPFDEVVPDCLGESSLHEV